MTYEDDVPPIWGGGIRWGTFRWGGAVTTGEAVAYVSAGGELLGIAQGADFGLGQADWFDQLSPQAGSVTVQGDIDLDPNTKVLITCAAGTLWTGYVDDTTTSEDLANATTTIMLTDVVGRLGTARPLQGEVYASGTFLNRFVLVGYYGDAVDVIAAYLAANAADLSLSVTEGPSTGTLPTLRDWDGPPDDLSLLQLFQLVAASSNAILTSTPAGDLVVTMRSAYPDPTVTMVDLGDTHNSSTRTRGRSTVINHWVLTRPTFGAPSPSVVLLDSQDATSVAAYGDRTYSIDNYLATSAAHFGAPFRAALAVPRSIVTRTFPIDDLGDPALMIAPAVWAMSGSDIWQVLSVKHAISLTDWTVTLVLDVSQNALNGDAEPTPV